MLKIEINKMIDSSLLSYSALVTSHLGYNIILILVLVAMLRCHEY